MVAAEIALRMQLAQEREMHMLESEALRLQIQGNKVQQAYKKALQITQGEGRVEERVSPTPPQHHQNRFQETTLLCRE